MKILHLITSLEIGGAQRLLSDLLPLQMKMAEVTLLVYRRVYNEFEQKVENAGVNIISLDAYSFYNPFLVFFMRRLFRYYNIIHVHLFPSLYWASFAAIGLNVKLVYTEHSTFNFRRKYKCFSFIERLVYSRYDKIISISLQVQKALIHWLSFCDDRFIVVNNGIDTAFFSSIKTEIFPRSLIMVSRFALSKDQETVIRAMNHIDRDVVLRFVGDGETREYCEKLAKALGLSDRIYFLGTRSDVAELIASSMIGIQSSKWEGFGLTAVEVMACGKPIIGTNVDGLRQVIEKAGLLFSVGDSLGLAMEVNKLLNNNSYYDRVANNCRERAKIYDIKVMGEKYMNVYRELMDCK